MHKESSVMAPVIGNFACTCLSIRPGHIGEDVLQVSGSLRQAGWLLCLVTRVFLHSFYLFSLTCKLSLRHHPQFGQAHH